MEHLLFQLKKPRFIWISPRGFSSCLCMWHLKTVYIICPTGLWQLFRPLYIHLSFRCEKCVINQDKLWKKYHSLTSSSSFTTSWEHFMTECNLPVEPMVYQHVTDELFDMLIKIYVTPLVTCADLQCQNLTYETENAVR